VEKKGTQRGQSVNQSALSKCNVGDMMYNYKFLKLQKKLHYFKYACKSKNKKIHLAFRTCFVEYIENYLGTGTRLG